MNKENLIKHLDNLTDTLLNIAKESGLSKKEISENMDGLVLAALAQEERSLKIIQLKYNRNREGYCDYFYTKLNSSFNKS